MSYRTNETGSHIITGILAVVLLGLIGFAGWRVMHHDKVVGSSTSNAAAATVKPLASSAIKTKADLAAAKKKLQDLDVDTAKTTSDISSLTK